MTATAQPVNRARSRRKPAPPRKQRSSFSFPTISTNSLPALTTITELISAFVTKRTDQLPSLVAGLIFTILTFFFFTQVQPQSVANILFYHSYLPAVFFVFISTALFAQYLLRNIRRAIYLGIVTSWWISLRLQSIATPFMIVLLPVIFFAVIELGLSLAERIGATPKVHGIHRSRRKLRKKV